MAKKLTVKKIARMIERHVSYFNGWSVSRESMRESCEKAAKSILRAISRRNK